MHLRRRRRPRRQRLVGADGVRHHRQGRHGDRQDLGDQAAAAQGRDGPRHAGRSSAFYDSFDDRTFNNPLPWSQGPRRMGTDKNADVLWVGNSWGATLARIDTKTLRDDDRPVARTRRMQPYHIAVDKNHNVWGNMWTADRIAKLRPGQRQVDDVRPAGARHRNPPRLAARARRQDTQVIVPIYRASKMGVMTLRSEADIAALKAQAN